MKIFLLLLLILPVIVSAHAGPVAINEVAWMGAEVDGIASGQHWRYEWLELFNPTHEAVQLSGWSVELYKEEELYFAIPLEGSLPPEGYVVVGASSLIPEVDINYANLGGKFVNEGMRVVLRDASGVMDEVDASDGWPGGDNESKRTMERTETAWQTSLSVGGTPGSENSSGLDAALAELKEKSPEGLFSGVTVVPLAVSVALALGSAAVLVRLRQGLYPQS